MNASASPIHRRTSDILRAIVEDDDDGIITLREFTHKLGDRTFALAILLFSLPNSLPIPGIPGFSTITGVPIAFIAVQMMLGHPTLWLPRAVAEKRFSQATMKKFLAKALPWIVRLEKVLRPRWTWACGTRAERVYGLMFLTLALIMALPIPGGNLGPGVAMSLMALGLLEKDGRLVLASVIGALVTLWVMVEVITHAFGVVWRWLAH